MLRRTEGSFRAGLWCLPGGKVDYGETVEEALRQEVLEETGLSCTSLRFLFYQDSLPLEDSGMHCIVFFFECSVEGDIELNDESTAHAWVQRTSLAQYRFAFRDDLGLVRYWDECSERQ